MNVRGCVPIKLYLHKLAGGRIWAKGCSLLMEIRESQRWNVYCTFLRLQFFNLGLRLVAAIVESRAAAPGQELMLRM